MRATVLVVVAACFVITSISAKAEQRVIDFRCAISDTYSSDCVGPEPNSGYVCVHAVLCTWFDVVFEGTEPPELRARERTLNSLYCKEHIIGGSKTVTMRRGVEHWFMMFSPECTAWVKE
jgi:hypothetical protein